MRKFFARAISATLLFGFASTAMSDPSQKAYETPYIYFNVFDATNDGSACFADDESAQAHRMLIVQQGACGGQSPRWTSAWPNSEGLTGWQQVCAPSGVPFVWGHMHEEGRTFQYDNQRCSGQTNDSIRRHLFYYCPAGYTYFEPVKDGNGTKYSPNIPKCQRPATAPAPEKEGGCGGCQQGGDPIGGNPINFAAGNKFQVEQDYAASGQFPLQLDRYYNSNALVGGRLGSNWRHSYEPSIKIDLINPAIMQATLQRADGRMAIFNLVGTAWQADADVRETLTWTTDASGAPTSWTVTDAQDHVEQYDATGRLLSIADRAGRQQTLAYDGSGNLATVTDSFGAQLVFAYTGGRLSSITDPAGATYSYSYDTAGNLTTVTYPGGAQRQYVYNESANTSNTNLPHALTGIVDESAQRYATWQYDSTGRATSSEHAGGAEHVGVVYNANGTSTVTDALGNARTFTLSVIVGVRKIASATGTGCASCGEYAAYGYDANGNINSKTDFNGVTATYAFDTTHRETSRTEASGTPRARTTTTQWHSTFRLPTLITEPNRTTSFTYDTSGNALTKTITDTTVSPNISRTWTYTYDSFGHTLTVDGPRSDVSDVTTYTYYNCATGYECGHIHTVTDALSHVITYNTYNAHGQPLTITDPNGVVTTLAYDSRQRLTSRTIGTEQTTFDYWPSGQLKKVTLPDSSYLQYIYDAAQRLTGVADGAGNHITYTLDAFGNRTHEDTYDPSSVLAFTHGRTFDNLGRLTQDIGAASQTTSYLYDSNGNVDTVTDPMNRLVDNEYDELNRLTRVTDPQQAVTQYAYDTNDHLSSVTDSRNLITSYAYNGFGDLKQLTSPDTGVTQYSPNASGNVDLATDARSKSADYAYDALNRLTSIAYSDQTLSFQYDQGTNGVGRLTQITDGSGTTQWTYDALGRVVTKQQAVGSIVKTIGYATNAVGQLSQITTPSGQTIGYGYANNKITSVTVNGSPLANSVLYAPFGATLGWTWSNSTLTVREYDEDGQLTTVDSAGLSTYHFNLDGTIKSRTDDAPVSYSLPIGTTSMSMSPSSNRVASSTGLLTRTYSYDAAGNTSGDGSRSFSYNDAGRIASSTAGGVTTTYLLNGLGQRVKKSNSSVTRYFVYDEAGHLTGEYDGSGTLVQELVWLDNIPIATLRPKAGGGVDVFYIHTDHLNTPRRITRPSDNAIVWRWDSDPFGTAAASSNPNGIGVFEFNLRFPGQYFDEETGLNYNYFRDYDSSVARFTESDPIGLKAGPNTYGYVRGNPVSYADPQGMDIYCPGGTSSVDPETKIITCTPNDRPEPPQCASGLCGALPGPVSSLPPGPFGPVCGPEGKNLATWIPDAHFSADFTPACAHHDRCYSCSGTPREECDNTFCKELLQSCHKAYGSRFGRQECDRMARLYCRMVRENGWEYYQGAK